jgi:hypothetical protein
LNRRFSVFLRSCSNAYIRGTLIWERSKLTTFTDRMIRQRPALYYPTTKQIYEPWNALWPHTEPRTFWKTCWEDLTILKIKFTLQWSSRFYYVFFNLLQMRTISNKTTANFQYWNFSEKIFFQNKNFHIVLPASDSLI